MNSVFVSSGVGVQPVFSRLSVLQSVSPGATIRRTTAAQKFSGLETENVVDSFEKKVDIPQKVTLLELMGPISTSSDNSRELMKSLLKIDPKKTPVILLRVDSPGGDPGTSEEIYEKLIQLREEGVKIIVSMGSVAASGAFLIASAGSYVFAPGMNTTGSLGAFCEVRSNLDVLKEQGIRIKRFVAGDFKDMDDLNKLEEEAKNQPPGKHGPRAALLQSVAEDFHQQFIEMVLKGRRGASSESAKALTEETLRSVADGRPLTGRQAFRLGLIDEVGGLSAAIGKANTEIKLRDAEMADAKASDGGG